jgi:hypothetical protein
MGHTILARTWWIDEPLVKAASNPTDLDLAQLRAEGFSVIFSFLDEKEQPAKYDKHCAAASGWIIRSYPIKEGGAASLDQLSEFNASVKALPPGTKNLMHCESGLGRKNRWKPVVAFAKPPPRPAPDWLLDAVFGAGRDKAYHEWGQQEAEARFFIENLTGPGALLVDPYAGGAAFLAAAKATGRRWLATERDETTAWIARRRLAEM